MSYKNKVVSESGKLWVWPCPSPLPHPRTMKNHNILNMITESIIWLLSTPNRVCQF